SLLPKEEEQDGATSFLSPDEGGTTMLSSEKGQAAGDGGTTMISAAPEEGGPSLLPKEEEQDGATSFLSSDDSESELLSLVDNLGAEEGGTQVVPLPTPKDESTPRSTAKTASQPAAGATRIARGSEREDVESTHDQTGGDSTADNVAAADGSTRMVRQSDTSEKSMSESTSPGSTTSDSIKDSDYSNKHVLRIHDRYQLSEILGKGGFGAVYLAEDTKLRRRCVVKQMLVGSRSRRELEIHRANFEREANLLAELNDPGHPNIPEIYDFFSLDSGNYLVMKYIEGQNLKELVSNREAKNLSWEEAVRYGADVCSALHYMHTKGIEPVMHRDIKPANIQLGDDGRVWLVDFGLAKADPVEDSGDQLVTQASGSFGYTALEQWFGQAIPASDIYAFGATLHHLVTGLDPLEAYDGQFHIQKIQELHGQFPLIRTINPDLPEKLEQIINVAVSPDPEQRPTALQLQQQLEALISGAQAVPLYTFKNGESANTVAELVDLCEKNRREAEEYLYGGDFERWFSLINRNDLAVAASAAVKQGKNQRDGLERFLKLILPSILQRRMRRFGVHLARGAIQFVLIALFVTVLLGVGGSYVVGLIMRQSIDSVPWNFYTLDLEEPNRYDEAFLTNAL
ncbi:MAG: serine/threonine-protein kinase, partial [Anaerolineae bacterium]|nr:serine/threonine-protein kinase [Anaerolineae bacterium]